jgi:hypothetical protein
MAQTPTLRLVEGPTDPLKSELERPLRMLVVVDQKMLAVAMRALLESSQEIDVVGHARGTARKRSPDYDQQRARGARPPA